MNFKLEYKNKINQVDTYISDYLNNNYGCSSPVLKDAMEYSVLNGGKRLRSILCLEICALLGGSYDDAFPFAAAIELIHAYSLVHDDLPAMDNSDTRRGQPSCHKKYGEAMGILCGDALLNSAYELMAMGCSNESSIKAMKCIASCAGATGMIDGQVIDLDISATKKYDISILTKLIELKTMALIKSAVVSGAILSKADKKDVTQMTDFAYHLGMAFQIRDDFEDIEQDASEECDSPNFVVFLGEEKAKEMLIYHSSSAMSIISKYDKSEFLKEMLNYLFGN